MTAAAAEKKYIDRRNGEKCVVLKVLVTTEQNKIANLYYLYYVNDMCTI
jgi:hypothetical protein